jgi:hypothetical protein
LFWNIKNNHNALYATSKMVQDQKTDILVLCEIDSENHKYLSKLLLGYESSLPMPNNRTYVFHRKDYKINKIKDGNYYSAFIINEVSTTILMITVHLPSRMHRTDSEIGIQASLIKREIEILEAQHNTENTIVVGDFNLNPFSDGMVSVDGFHAVMCLNTALKKKRKVDREEYRYFFNPMWAVQGNHENTVLGTYYHHKNPISYVWNLFDQVILRPSLINKFDISELDVVTIAGENSLLTENGLPDRKKFSDHLPIKFKISI